MPFMIVVALVLLGYFLGGGSLEGIWAAITLQFAEIEYQWVIFGWLNSALTVFVVLFVVAMALLVIAAVNSLGRSLVRS